MAGQELEIQAIVAHDGSAVETISKITYNGINYVPVSRIDGQPGSYLVTFKADGTFEIVPFAEV